MNKLQIIVAATCSMIILLSVVAFLIVGIVTDVWHPTWLIIIAGVIVCAIASIIIKAMVEVNKEEQKYLS